MKEIAVYTENWYPYDTERNYVAEATDQTRWLMKYRWADYTPNWKSWKVHAMWDWSRVDKGEIKVNTSIQVWPKHITLRVRRGVRCQRS